MLFVYMHFFLYFCRVFNYPGPLRRRLAATAVKAEISNTFRMAEIIKIKKGLDKPLPGRADTAESVDVRPVRVGIVPADFPGYTWKLLVKVGDKVEIVGLTDEKKKTVVTGIEMFHKLRDYAEAGDNIGALLRGVDKKSIERGQVLAKPGSIHPHTHYMGQVYVLTKEEGGRHTPFFNGYRPQFYFRTTDVTGNIKLPEGTEMVMPGDNIDMEITLITPIALEQGLRFAIREGGRTVGSGVVAKVIE